MPVFYNGFHFLNKQRQPHWLWVFPISASGLNNDYNFMEIKQAKVYNRNREGLKATFMKLKEKGLFTGFKNYDAWERKKWGRNSEVKKNPLQANLELQ